MTPSSSVPEVNAIGHGVSVALALGGEDDFDQPVDCRDFQHCHLDWSLGKVSTDQRMSSARAFSCFS